ncbi:thiamine phosphate synthase [Alkalibacterium sp.]|nr:MAG: thiamine phosphate synthase [Alkalibacterium sp.]
MPRQSKVDVSAYFVVGPENTKGRDVASIIKEVVEAGFTCIQVRSKVASARELIQLTREAAEVIEASGRADEVTLLVDDRLDVVLAAREEGIKVDGIHVGQSDIPVEVCRKYLGEDAVIGLSTRTEQLFEYVKSENTDVIDYFGGGPLHETETKPDCGASASGEVITRSYDEIAELAKISPIPVVIGGGVKLHHVPELAKTGVDGFFVVSALSQADKPKEEAEKFVSSWKANQPN